jgi:hypothetical protein
MKLAEYNSKEHIYIDANIFKIIVEAIKVALGIKSNVEVIRRIKNWRG